MNTTHAQDLLKKVEHLNSIGITLSAETDKYELLEKVLAGAREVTGADGGTLYLLDEDSQQLNFAIMHNDTLNIRLGGSTGKAIELQPISLTLANGEQNLKTIAAFAANTGQTINIRDAYTADGFDFSGTQEYDRRTGYRSTSFLAVPMRNHEQDIIGVLQLINCHDADGRVIAFSQEDQQLLESLASQAAVALTKHMLISELQNLLEKFIEMIAGAIDEKSPYTGGHCRRVPEIAMHIAEAVQNNNKGPLAEAHFSEAELYEMRIAALMHDCGKITTPVHVIDKATKLETLFDRLELVDSRFEILRRDAEINFLKQRIAALESGDDSQLPRIQKQYDMFLQQLDENQALIHKCNRGTEFMPQEERFTVEQIGNFMWQDKDGKERTLLTENEIHNLQIPKGTLTEEERQVINGHITTTQRMLESLPFPKHLRRVPEIAGNHHERMDGKGYPNGLTGEQMSLPARMMCIADIFEALTATDRPYKQPMKLSQALKILASMRDERHIDGQIFEVFVREKAYLPYAEKYLTDDQMDEVDESQLFPPRQQAKAS